MKPVGHHAALVNGAGSDLGRAITAALVHDGYRVCAADTADTAALARQAGGQRLVTVSGAADDVDHQDDAVERALGVFGRIDVLVNLVPPHSVLALLRADAGSSGEDLPAGGGPGDSRPFRFGVAPGANPLGWIEKVDLAWTAEHGGWVLNVFDPALVREGRWPARAAARLSRWSADLQDHLGPTTRMTSLLPAGPTGGAGYRGSRSTPVMPLRTSATVPEVVSYLLSRRGQGLAGRTLLAERAGAPWTVVDAPLPAPTGSRRGTVVALRRPERADHALAPAAGEHRQAFR
jgi:hypothetical protein